MNIVLYVIAGALVDDVASRIMRTNSQQGPLLDIVVGIDGTLSALYWMSGQSTKRLHFQPFW